MRISDWSSDVCSSDLVLFGDRVQSNRRRVIFERQNAAGDRFTRTSRANVDQVLRTVAGLETDPGNRPAVRFADIRPRRDNGPVYSVGGKDRKSTRMNSSH